MNNAQRHQKHIFATDRVTSSHPVSFYALQYKKHVQQQFLVRVIS